MRLNPVMLGLSLLLHLAALAWILNYLQPGHAPTTAVANENFMSVRLITLEPDTPKPVISALPVRRPLTQKQEQPLAATSAVKERTRDTAVATLSPITETRVPEPAHEVAVATQDQPINQTTDTAVPAAETPDPARASLAVQSDAELPVMREPRFRSPPRPPDYPRLSRQRGESGTVLIRARVEPDGSITNLQVSSSSGYALLDRAALLAAHGWQIEPWRRGAITLAAWVELPVVFELRQNGPLARRH